MSFDLSLELPWPLPPRRVRPAPARSAPPAPRWKLFERPGTAKEAAEVDEQDARWSAWMAEAQDGDAQAYQRLLRELTGALTAFLSGRLGRPDLVEDCVQETLLAVHKARHTYDPRRPFKPWVYTIARRKCVDAIRRRATRGAHEVEASDATDERAATHDSGEPRMDAGRALRILPPALREAVILTKLDGCTVEEAAARAGVSPSAMRSRAARGMNQLRAHFEGADFAGA